MLQSVGLQRFVHEWETEQQVYMSTYGVLLWEIQLIFYNKGFQYYCIHCSVFHPVWQSLSFNIFCQCNCSYAVCLITQLYPTLSNPMECSPPGSSVSGILQQEYWSGLAFPSQVIFPTQGLNLGLPHCRQILYHLNHQGSL